MVKRILFVGMVESIHCSRWISQIVDEKGFEIYMYPSNLLVKPNPELPSIKIVQPFISKSSIGKLLLRIMVRFFQIDLKKFTAKGLGKAIRHLKPDLIHSLETQQSGYLILDVKKNLIEPFPRWWHTNWGSDVYLFGRLEEHKKKIEEVLRNCDYYSCESERDVKLGRAYGFEKTVMPVYPNAGGFDIEKLQLIRNLSEKTSARKIIMLKGYQGWAGRCLVGIRALNRVKDLLDGYEILIYSNPNTEDVVIAARLLSLEAKIPVEFVPINSSHAHLLKLHSKARISIALSISDAISISALEAMSVGSFPIQSDTSTADEWFKHGKSGFLVPAEDPEIIEQSLRLALTDDRLVDEAADINWKKIKVDADYGILKKKTITSYNSIFNNKLENVITK